MMSVAESNEAQGRSLAVFACWLGLFILLNAIGIAWLRYDGIDMRTGFGPGILVIAYSSTAAALVIAAFARGRAGLLEVWRSLLRWRVGIGWYALVIALPMAIVPNAVAVATFAGGADAPLLWQANWAALATGWGPVVAGAVGEEIGWRGFLQPLLRKLLGSLWACVIVGVIWGTWHLIADLISPQESMPLAIAAAHSYGRMIATAVLYGWLYEKTGSLPLVMAAHVMHNVAIHLFPLPEQFARELLIALAVLYALAAVPAARVLWKARLR
jgi:membrane protease YdiL (CAAX protease family)